MIIYKITNLINTKIYIGKDSKNNPDYLGSGKILKQAIKKYGINNFKKEILEYCTENNINDREKYWIKILNAQNRKIGYNILEGGHGIGSGKNCYWYGKAISDQHRLNLSKCKKGDKNPNFKKTGKLSPLFGTKISASIKEKISKKLKKRFSTKLQHPMYGKQHSKESKIKMSKSHTGVKLSKSHVNNRVKSKCKYFYKLISPEGKEFITNNYSKFCRNYNLCSSGICKVINKKTKSYKGWTAFKIK